MMVDFAMVYVTVVSFFPFALILWCIPRDPVHEVAWHVVHQVGESGAQRSLLKQRGHFITRPLLKKLSKYMNSNAGAHNWFYRFRSNLQT